MEYKNILDISSREEFRSWLSIHHADEQECYVLLNEIIAFSFFLVPFNYSVLKLGIGFLA